MQRDLIASRWDIVLLFLNTPPPRTSPRGYVRESVWYQKSQAAEKVSFCNFLQVTLFFWDSEVLWVKYETISKFIMTM